MLLKLLFTERGALLCALVVFGIGDGIGIAPCLCGTCARGLCTVARRALLLCRGMCGGDRSCGVRCGIGGSVGTACGRRCGRLCRGTVCRRCLLGMTCCGFYGFLARFVGHRDLAVLCGGGFGRFRLPVRRGIPMSLFRCTVGSFAFQLFHDPFRHFSRVDIDVLHVFRTQIGIHLRLLRGNDHAVGAECGKMGTELVKKRLFVH